MKAVLLLGLAAASGVDARLGQRQQQQQQQQQQHAEYTEYATAMAAPLRGVGKASAQEALVQGLEGLDTQDEAAAAATALVEMQTVGEGRPAAVGGAGEYHGTRKEARVRGAGSLPPPPRFAAAGARLVPFGSSANPYSLGSVYGRGAQDGMTPFSGTYSGAYGPMPGSFGTAGYGSFPGSIDPRGFGGTWNHSAPYGTFFGPMMGGVPKEGFKYQVPWSPLHPGAPYTGQPFSSMGMGGPYWSPMGYGGNPDDPNNKHPSMMNCECADGGGVAVVVVVVVVVDVFGGVCWVSLYLCSVGFYGKMESVGQGAVKEDLPTLL
jgi:hypothetical protein